MKDQYLYRGNRIKAKSKVKEAFFLFAYTIICMMLGFAIAFFILGHPAV